MANGRLKGVIFLIVSAACVKFTTATKRVACNGQMFYIGCSFPSSLRIKSAVWGRGSSSFCRVGNFQRTGCVSDKLKGMKKACEGKRYCRFQISPSILGGNPCKAFPGVLIYLLVEYECRGPPTPPTIGPAVKTACGKNTKADIYFMIDSSGSVRQHNFVHLLRFVNTLINSLAIGQNGVRVGVIRFSSSSQLIFPLNRHYTKAALRRIVRYIPFVSGNTATAATLNMMRTLGFAAANGARPGVPRVGILITDGIPNSTPNSVRQAQLSKQAGIEIFCVAAQAPPYAIPAIRSIASKPKKSHSFIVDKFSQMSMKAPYIATKICQKLAKRQPTTPQRIMGVSMMHVIAVIAPCRSFLEATQCNVMNDAIVYLHNRNEATIYSPGAHFDTTRLDAPTSN